jgi:branched-chain amino acid transport system substrate-binding protein
MKVQDPSRRWRQLCGHKQAKSLNNFKVPVALPGITINTSATVNQLWTQMRLQRWSGSNWQQFGEVLDANSE